MTSERWDRIKCITTIVALLGVGILQACNKVPDTPKPEVQVQVDLQASAEKHRHARQRALDEASVVCRDGTSYLIGDNYETRNDSGPFAVPYYRNGEIVKCGADSLDAAPREDRP